MPKENPAITSVNKQRSFLDYWKSTNLGISRGPECKDNKYVCGAHLKCVIQSEANIAKRLGWKVDPKCYKECELHSA